MERTLRVDMNCACSWACAGALLWLLPACSAGNYIGETRVDGSGTIVSDMRVVDLA